jgi:nitrite reductase (NADH) small subunit
MVIHFDESEANFVATDAGNYFLWRDELGVAYMLPADCPHRGGPLWLGTLDDGRIRCPWHESLVSQRSLERRALPTVVNRTNVTTIAPGSEAHTRTVTGVDGGPPCPARREPCI